MNKSILALSVFAALTASAAAAEVSPRIINPAQVESNYDAGVDTFTTQSISEGQPRFDASAPDASRDSGLQRGGQSSVFGANGR